MPLGRQAGVGQRHVRAQAAHGRGAGELEGGGRAVNQTARRHWRLPAACDPRRPPILFLCTSPYRATPGEARAKGRPAILRRAEMTGVYVLDAQGQPRLRQVRLGRATGELVEVLSGVSKGEQVAADPKTVNAL